ncbi:flagellar hook-basal body complex protein FliE [bacterium]|nr:flagellar hook-basal body complex protein FliE [bacterium]
MDFSTSIQNFNTEFNLNAVKDYNKFLQKQDAFDLDTKATEFSNILDVAMKSVPLRDKSDPSGLGVFANQIGNSFGNALNAVNDAKLYSEKLEEDLAMGGSTNIHEAMIAAEKAELSMQMAIQVRNRILTAYTEINSMAI